MNTQIENPFSVAVLAGGQSKRMGQNKALLSLGDIPVLQRVINAVQHLSDDVFLVTNTPQTYAEFGLPMVADVIPGKAALGGIYSAIYHAKHPWILTVACDMPLLDSAVIAFMAQQRSHVDIVTPLINNHPEALHAFYKKTCLPFIERQIQDNRLKIIDFFKDVTVTYISKEQLLTVAPNLDFLINLNTPQDLSRVKNILAL